jgi:quercetin dioxygenase-like cupin family protein
VGGRRRLHRESAREEHRRLGFIEASVPPGGGPVAHAHVDEGEAFCVLEGELEFLTGDEKIAARSGDFLHVPPGIRHRFRNQGVHTAKLLFLFTPGGQEEVFIQGATNPSPAGRRRTGTRSASPRRSSSSAGSGWSGFRCRKLTATD